MFEKTCLYVSNRNCDNKIYCYTFTTEGIHFQDTNLSSTKENNSLVEDENLQTGESEQKDHVEQPVKHSNITPEIVIPPGEKIFVVIVCTAV